MNTALFTKCLKMQLKLANCDITTDPTFQAILFFIKFQ
jgi:hypothetical protein